MGLGRSHARPLNSSSAPSPIGKTVRCPPLHVEFFKRPGEPQEQRREVQRAEVDGADVAVVSSERPVLRRVRDVDDGPEDPGDDDRDEMHGGEDDIQRRQGTNLQ